MEDCHTTAWVRPSKGRGSGRSRSALPPAPGGGGAAPSARGTLIDSRLFAHTRHATPPRQPSGHSHAHVIHPPDQLRPPLDELPASTKALHRGAALPAHSPKSRKPRPCFTPLPRLVILALRLPCVSILLTPACSLPWVRAYLKPFVAARRPPPASRGAMTARRAGPTKAIQGRRRPSTPVEVS